MNSHIIVKKARRTLELYDGGKLIKSYQAVLGFSPTGDKETEGDGRTPEGDFFVFVKNDKSKFTVSLGVSYPGVDNADRGLRENLITPDDADAIKSAVESRRMPPQKTALGGEIYIHGGGAKSDWTDGCIALDDADMRELFDAVTVGVPITILP